MLPSRHIIASFPLGIATGYFTNSQLAGLVCFLSGVLVDIDHIIEYIIHFGFRNFKPKEVYRTCGKMTNPRQEGGVERVYLIFHAGEIAVLLWAGFAFTKNIFLLAIALGYTVHLILDGTTNVMKPSGYFISLRIKNRFKKEKFIKQHRCTSNPTRLKAGSR